MQVSLETIEGLERRMKVSIPAERIDTEVASRLKNLTRTVRLKGFRPGKVPIKVIESRYGPEVRREVVDEVTRRSFYEAVNREQLPVVGAPRFRLNAFEPGSDLEYEAEFEVLGKIDLKPMDDVVIKRPAAEITEEDVDRMLDNLRRQRGEWQAVDRAAAKDDRLIIDFVGRIDGEEFSGNRGEKVPLMIGAGQFIAGFEDGLIGATAGEQRTVDVRFPDDYHVQTVAGKQAQFEITVHEVAELMPAEVTEDFIRSFDVADGTLEAMRAELRKTMQDEMDEAIRDRVRRQALDALHAGQTVELPKSQVQSEMNMLAGQARDMLRRQGVPESAINVDPTAFEEQAKRRVALGLLVAEIARQEHFKAAPDQVRQRVDGIAAGYENPDEVRSWYYSDRSRLANVEHLVIEEQVVDWMVSKARVEDEPTDFSTLLKERQGRNGR
ncbi:MAG: trigger factor [Gammaproteobacteria bacterium]|jgi:trigger factor|nr:trigger factor [Gammaproteobacteria bacterium]